MRDPRFAQSRAWNRHNQASPEDIEAARTSARAVAEGAADKAWLDAAWKALEENHRNAWVEFRDEFVDAARKPDRLAAWTDAFEKAFVAARDNLASSVALEDDAASFRTLVDDWSEERDPFTVWRDNRSDVVRLRRDIDDCAMLMIRIDPARGVRALDTLPYPALASELLVADAIEDRDLIEELIRVAPPVFDAHGAWLPSRSISALLVTTLIIRHAEALESELAYAARARMDAAEKVRAEAELEQARQHELPAWMQRAFDLLLQRSDGLHIAIGYLGHLSREVLLGRGLSHDGKDDWTVYAAALNALANALRQAAVRVAQVREAWLAAEKLAKEKETQDAKHRRVHRRSSNAERANDAEGARSLHAEGLPLLLGAAVLLGNAPQSESEIEAFWSWFDELLDGRDPGLSLITHGRSLGTVPQRFGFLVSRLPSPAAHLRKTYQKLEPQRRRALYGHRYEEIHEDLESIVLLRVAINAATNWLDRVKETDVAESAREFFFWIYDAARRLWLTTNTDTQHQKESLVAVCFAAMPFLFGKAIDSALKRAIPPIANDARVLADACAHLQLNGISAPDLRKLVTEAGADLVAALEDVFQWSQLTGRKEDFPPLLQQLATDLHVDFKQEKPAPESERTRALRERFVAVIPWGSALLRRLEVDGCSEIRALPLNQQNHSWMLQVTLGSELRERFGLAPDIRILASLGMPRGQDIRRAAEEPEHFDNVNPDLLLVATAVPELPDKLPRLAGPWGQRVPWVFTRDRFSPLSKLLSTHLPAFNIFDRRDPVRGHAFFGRRREIETIVSRLLRGQAVGVFGLRKVGKSSLLQAVAEQLDPEGATLAALGSRARLLSETRPEAFVVSLDVQGIVTRTQDAVAEQLWEGLKQRLRTMNLQEESTSADSGETKPTPVMNALNDEAPSKDPLDNLRRLVLTTISRSNMPPICFIIDEVDLLFEGYGGEAGVVGIERTFALLRNLGQSTGRVSLALIGRDPVFVEQPHLNGFTNPLLGWVESLRIGPLADTDADELLSCLGRRAGLDIDSSTVELALRLTGGHPLLLREFGSALHEVSRESRPASPAKTNVLQTRALEVFMKRDVVHTICGEIEVLLRTRFPDALSLLQRAADLPENDLRAHLFPHGTSGGRAAQILFDFGLLCGDHNAPWLPLLYRQFFGAIAPASQVFSRSQAHGEPFQEQHAESL